MANKSDRNENFFWDNQSWIFSDNSNGDVGIDVLIGTIGDEDQYKGKKVLDLSNSSRQNIIGACDVAAPVEDRIRKKRSTIGGGGGGGGVGGSDVGNSSKKASGNAGGGGESKVGGQSDRVTHLVTERERRKKIRNMFSSLRALIPHLPPRAEKYTIVDEAVRYIKSLEQSLKKLQKQNLERLHGMSTMDFTDPSRLTRQKQGALMETRESFMADKGSSSNLATMNATNPCPSFSNIPRFPMSSMAFQTLISPNVVLNVCGEDAQISVWSFKKPGVLSKICSILDMHKLEVVCAHAFGDDVRNMYMIQARANSTDYQLPEGVLVGEAFKHAAAEIMLWITNS